MGLAAQIIGIVAIVVSVLSMLFKSKTNVLLATILYNILTLTSYLLLGKYLGSILVGILTVKSLIYYFFALKKIKPNIWILIILEITILGVSIFLWQSWVDVFMLINSLINTYTSWQDNVSLLKVGAVVSSVLLIFYDAFIGAYVYIVSEVLYGGAALLSIFMQKIQSKKTKKLKYENNDSDQENIEKGVVDDEQNATN